MPNKMASQLRRLAKFLYWLTLTGTVFAASEAARTAPVYRFYRVARIDVYATYGWLGTVCIAATLPVSALLAWMQAAGQRYRSRMLEIAPFGVAFALAFAVWCNLLRPGLARLLPRLGRTPAMAQVLAFLLLGSVVFSLRPAQISQWMEKSAPTLRGASLGSALTCGLLTVYLFVEPLCTSRTASPRNLVPGARPPHVVLIVLDSLTSHDMSLYGYDLPTTPNVDRLCQGWTVYENAHTAGAGTLACLPTMVTGRYPYLDDWPRYGDLARRGQGWLSLAQLLRASGYHTAYIAEHVFTPSFYHLHTGFDWIAGGMCPPALDLTLHSRFLPWTLNTEYGWGGASVSVAGASGVRGFEPTYHNASEYFHQRALDASARPFFVYMHMMRPHEYYLANEYMGTFLPLEAGLTDVQSQQEAFGDTVPRAYPPEKQPLIDQLRLRYNENILLADAQLAGLVNTLQELGLYEHSLIIVSADHGETFRSGYVTHYTPLLSAPEHAVPLLVKYPEQVVGVREAGLVSTIDIVPTILEAAGVPYPTDWVDGQPLRVACKQQGRVLYTRLPHEFAKSHGFTAAALCGSLKLVYNRDGLHLYDLANDPEEQFDLLGQREVSSLHEALRRLDERMRFVRTGGPIEQAPDLVTTLQLD